MTKVRVSKRSRVASTALAAALMLFLVGDRAAYTAIPGIDPLDVLDLAVRNNVLFVIDDTQSMGGTPESKGNGGADVGGDDPASRFYQAKRAVREVIGESVGLANFGMSTFHVNPEEHQMRSGAFGGPLHYVSQDPGAAAWLGYFNGPSVNFANYDGLPLPISTEVYASLDNGSASGHNWHLAYPGTCTPNTTNPATQHTLGKDCRYYIKSMLMRNNVRFTWNPSVAANRRATHGLVATQSPIPGGCPLPPAGLLGDDVLPFNDGTKKRACFQILNNQTTPPALATYYLTSSSFYFVDKDGSAGGNSCQQAGIKVDVPTCTDDSVVQKIQDQMRLQLQIDDDATLPGAQNNGLPIDVPAATDLLQRIPHDDPISSPTTFVRTGLRTAQDTAIADSLRFAKDYFVTVFARPPGVIAKQKNFVILLTDGAETCDPVPGAPRAAAEALYNLTPSVETLVIAFAEGVDAANEVARGGSGNLRDAFSPQNLDDLKQALKDAISLASSSGTYSAQASITESIYELGPVLPLPGVDPMDPETRYTANVPVLVRSTFDMPGFKGRLKAFRHEIGASGVAESEEVWDAGQRLLDRVKGTAALSGMEVGGSVGGSPCPTRTVDSVGYKACTFYELLGNDTATEQTVETASKLKRRIYTTTGNNLAPVAPEGLMDRTANVTASNTTAYRVPLWPPTRSSSDGVSPNDNSSSAGKLDDALGLLSLTEAQLKTKFKACVHQDVTKLHADCTSNDATTKLNYHRREAREMVLAFLAGAQTIVDKDGNLARCGTSGACNGNNAKRLLFKARPWILSESTLSAPSVVTPPLESKPTIHPDEYTLFRDGPRVSGVAKDLILQGFGMRNPDKDDGTASGSTTLKPAMTVVYHGANDGLHAFRAAPCPDYPPFARSLPCSGETGGEELWSFVPFDQLGKLASLMKTQRRSDKTYMIVSPVRFADVWVPGSFAETINGASVAGDGVWRTLIYFGRGIGGKYYTALDVTVPGPFTRHSLTGGWKYAPLPVWSRGNHDTSDGKPSGTQSGTQPVIPFVTTLEQESGYTKVHVSGAHSNAVGDTCTITGAVPDIFNGTWTVISIQSSSEFFLNGPTGAQVDATSTGTTTCTGTTGNVYNNGQADYTAYLRMGQTWSVPAIGNVNAAENTTARTPAGVEFVAYVGSGYGPPCSVAPCEGTTFYALDALTGDVIASTDVGPATAPSDAIFTPNALTASPAVFSPNMLKYQYIGNPAGEKATRVYIGDNYGRLWKFLPRTAKTGFPAILMQDLGVRQPIGAPVALMNLDYDGSHKPYVFLETGRDNRVTPPPAETPPFKLIGLRDDASDMDERDFPEVTPYELFQIDFPGAPDPVRWRFRGTTQPATAFNERKKGRVFFAGIQFNPIDAGCISSFDSILFALTAGTGAPAYDMGQADPRLSTLGYTTFIDQKITGVQVFNGQLVVDQGIGADTPPPPPAPPTTLPAAPGAEGEVFLGSELPASTPYRVGSVVCQP